VSHISKFGDVNVSLTYTAPNCGIRDTAAEVQFLSASDPENCKLSNRHTDRLHQERNISLFSMKPKIYIQNLHFGC
jgi:hypothetical protein